MDEHKALTGLADALDGVGQAFVTLASAIDDLISTIGEEDGDAPHDLSDSTSDADAATDPEAAPAAAAVDAIQAGAQQA